MTEDQDQHRDKRQKLDNEGEKVTGTMDLEPATQPTNHDRNEPSQKEDVSATEVMEDVTDTNEVSLDQLRKDMGDAFLLGRSSKIHSLDHFPQLLTFFSRTASSRSVSRNPHACRIWTGAASQDCG